MVSSEMFRTELERTMSKFTRKKSKWRRWAIEYELSELADKYRLDYSVHERRQDGLKYVEWSFVPFDEDWGHAVSLTFLENEPWYEIEVIDFL